MCIRDSGNIQGGWGGCSGSGTLPNSDEPMIDISSPNRAGEGPKRGHFVSTSFSLRPLASGRRLLKLRGMSINPHEAAPTAGPVFFDRRELDPILRVYGRMVAQGEWRDYAMVGHKDFAEFAVFRRSGDAPLYRIEKRPALQTRQGQWLSLIHI